MRELDPASGAFRPRRKSQLEDEGGDVASGRYAQTRALHVPPPLPGPVSGPGSKRGGGFSAAPAPPPRAPQFEAR